MNDTWIRRGLLFAHAMTLLALIVIASGCTTLTPDERALQHSLDTENWELCKRIYKIHDVRIISSHDHRRHLEHRNWQVREDLRDNACRITLGSYWVTR